MAPTTAMGATCATGSSVSSSDGDASVISPAPAPYPATTKTKGWVFEMDVDRMQQSDTWALAPAEVRPWLLMMWVTAWGLTPSGTLPSDEAVLCARIGMAPKVFAKHRALLLRGWTQADDGRLYHETITALVLQMLQRRKAGAYRKFRSVIVERDGLFCSYCGTNAEKMTLDHVIPQSRGGSHAAENLVLACRSCNSSKGAKTPGEWLT